MKLRFFMSTIATLAAQVSHNSFTERDGRSWCVVRIGGTIGGGVAIAAMSAITIRFFQVSQPDFTGMASCLGAFGGCMVAIGGVIAAKNATERVTTGEIVN